MKRRTFVEFIGSLLTTLGLSQLDLQRQGEHYAQVLAQPTRRKLALLVGINQYPESSLFPPLLGCVTDVQLQRELLIHRFGFQPQDIVILTDKQATRQNLLTTFEEHLIKQSQPGDVAVFHYSGHGSRVADPDRDFSDGLNSTFVPVDSLLPQGFPEKGGTVLDITGHTLFLLTKAIKTDNLTVVLDSCHSGGGTRGNLRVRSRIGGAQLQASPEEQELQDRWRSRLNLSLADFIQQRRLGIANGVVIAATKRDQLATDAPFSDFDAGVFTYLLTQYLWQQIGNDPIKNTLPNVARTTNQFTTQSQQPEYEVKPKSGNENQPFYFLTGSKPPADGVITKLDGDRAEVWLGGIDSQSIAAFGSGAKFGLVDAQNQTVGEIEMDARKGLIGLGKVTKASSNPTIPIGTLVQEQVRSIPADLTLIIGLDNSLGEETAKAQQVLEQLPRVKAVPLHQGVVHYILGRMTETTYREISQQKSANAIPSVGTIGLFSLGGDVLPGAFGSVGETMTEALKRLKPKLKSLLAAQLIKMTLNTNSSRLNLIVTLSPEGQKSQLVAEVFPTRGFRSPTQASRETPQFSPFLRLPLGTPVQFQVKNQENSKLYLSLLVIDPTGEMTVIFPNQWTASEVSTQIETGQTFYIPDVQRDSFQLVTQEPKGVVEVLILASRTPIQRALKGLQAIASHSGQSRGPVTLPDPIEIMDALLDDLNAEVGTRGASSRGLGAVTRLIDTTQMVTMSITFEVI